MSENTKIEWADHTFNPWIGCTKVGPGCDNCYAKATWEDRKHRVTWGAGQARIRTKTWGDPVKWNKQADAFFAEHGRRQRVFCASLADVFDNEVQPQWRNDLFELIIKTPNLDWLLLTKRIGNAAKMLQDVSEHFGVMMNANDRYVPLPNVWLGATIVSQAEADRDIPKLLDVPAAKRFLSMEPLLGPVAIESYLLSSYDKAAHDNQMLGTECRTDKIDWVIVGGESGPNARPMHPDWARSLRDQCEAAGVPFLFKQWGEWLPGHHYTSELQDLDNDPVQSRYPCAQWDGEWHVGHIFGGDQWDDGALWRVGKKAAGRQLDGRTWDEVPA